MFSHESLTFSQSLRIIVRYRDPATDKCMDCMYDFVNGISNQQRCFKLSEVHALSVVLDEKILDREHIRGLLLRIDVENK